MRFNFSRLEDDPPRESAKRTNDGEINCTAKTMPAAERVGVPFELTPLFSSSELNHLSKIAWIDGCHFVPRRRRIVFIKRY